MARTTSTWSTSVIIAAAGDAAGHLGPSAVFDPQIPCAFSIQLDESINELSRRMKVSERRFTAAVKTSGTSLTDVCVLGPSTAALIFGHTGNIGRFPSRHRCASYNGTARIAASSGDKVGTG